jgi:CheY-like chemotaxis protein
VRQLQTMAEAFAQFFHSPVDIQVYLTPGQSQAFGWHYDLEEVFIIQVQGCKEYTLRQNTVNPFPVWDTMPADLHFEVGPRVEVCDSAEDFSQSGHLPDTACLIVDVRMPRMSGLELQRQLATVHCPIPLIFITAHEDGETRARALNAGAVAFLYKPFSDQILLGAVHTALHSSRGGR